MLTVTESAADHLEKLLDECDAPEGGAARFVPEENQLSLQVDSPKPEDETFEHHGKTILVMDQQVSEVLADKRLELKQTNEGVALTLQSAQDGGEDQ
jgi:Fe-S cluster assembly iron-binding protein IscA